MTNQILQRIIENPKSKEARVLECGKDYFYGDKVIILNKSFPYLECLINADNDNRSYGNGKYLLQWGFKYEGKEYWEDDVLTDGYIIEWGLAISLTQNLNQNWRNKC